jgi:hypothetical protein
LFNHVLSLLENYKRSLNYNICSWESGSGVVQLSGVAVDDHTLPQGGVRQDTCAHGGNVKKSKSNNNAVSVSGIMEKEDIFIPVLEYIHMVRLVERRLM